MRTVQQAAVFTLYKHVQSTTVKYARALDGAFSTRGDVKPSEKVRGKLTKDQFLLANSNAGFYAERLE